MCMSAQLMFKLQTCTSRHVLCLWCSQCPVMCWRQKCDFIRHNCKLSKTQVCGSISNKYIKTQLVLNNLFSSFRPIIRTTTDIPGPRPIQEVNPGSGEPPCGSDDEDCNGSGSGDDRVDPVNTPHPVTDDIYITSPEPTRKRDRDEHRSSTPNPMVVTVNMTTIPPRRPSSVITKRTPHASDFPPTQGPG